MAVPYTIIFEFAIVGYGCLPCAGYPVGRVTSSGVNTTDPSISITYCAQHYPANTSHAAHYVHPGAYGRGTITVPSQETWEILGVLLAAYILICICFSWRLLGPPKRLAKGVWINVLRIFNYFWNLIIQGNCLCGIWQQRQAISGIPNIGNTCYMNAVLQVLCWTPNFKEQLQNATECIASDFSNNETGQQVVETSPRVDQSMLILIESVQAGKRVPRELPKAVLRDVRQLDDRFEGYDQQDSYHLFNTVIGGLEDLMQESGKCDGAHKTERLMNTSPISRLFGGVFVTVYTYSSCQHIETVFQRFTSISVQIPPKRKALVHDNDVEESTIQPSLSLPSVPPSYLSRSGLTSEVSADVNKQMAKPKMIPHQFSNENADEGCLKFGDENIAECVDSSNDDTSLESYKTACSPNEFVDEYKPSNTHLKENIDTTTQAYHTDSSTAKLARKSEHLSSANEREAIDILEPSHIYDHSEDTLEDGIPTLTVDVASDIKMSPAPEYVEDGDPKRDKNHQEQGVDTCTGVYNDRPHKAHYPHPSVDRSTDTGKDKLASNLAKGQQQHRDVGCLRTLNTKRRGQTDLENGLTLWTEVEERSGDLSCRICPSSRDKDFNTVTRSRLMFLALPPILVFQFNRFEMNKYGELVKFDEYLSYPEYLDVAPFCSSAFDFLNSRDHQTIGYRLYGVVCHRGSMKGGHYTSRIRTTGHHAEDMKKRFLSQKWDNPEKYAEDMLTFWTKNRDGDDGDGQYKDGKTYRHRRNELIHSEQYSNENETAPEGDNKAGETWYTISDEHVMKCAKKAALRDANAYMLMYERV